MAVTRNALRFAIAAGVVAATNALPAKALDTITFNPGLISTNAGNLNPNQQFAVDLESLTTAVPLDGGFEYGFRYRNVTAASTGTGLFAGVTGIARVVGNPNNITISYNSSVDDIVGNSPELFSRSLNVSVPAFYLSGLCQVCGESNTITISTTAASGLTGGAFEGAVDELGTPTSGLYSFNSTAPIAFNFGSSPFRGTFSFTGSTEFSGIQPLVNGRNFTITAVPGPLPIAGAAFAFCWSRKLRQRINDQTTI